MTDKVTAINFYESDCGIFLCDPKPNYMKERRKYMDWRDKINARVELLEAEWSGMATADLPPANQSRISTF
jgi:hypothetical protein